MARTSLRTRKRTSASSAQPTTQDLVLALAKAVGIDLEQEYDPESFADFAINLSQSDDPETYTEQGQYLYSLLQALAQPTAQASALVQTERVTKVWFQHSLQVLDLKDSAIVDSLLVYPGMVKPVFDATNGDLSFLAIDINDD